jgi:E3 ubiquitin-protein ligase UBR1
MLMLMLILVLAMVAQIRVGLWVRNGFAIRGQLLHYRDFMLRELCYDQDLFVAQTALVVLNPDLVLVSILDRFQLLNYFSGITLHESYEDAQLSGMVEEVLYVITAILTESANAKGMSLRDAIRREIVHALAVGPCTFTDLVKRVAERMVDDVSFEHVLKEVAHFRAPESNIDCGTYELRSECYSEVDPFFYHYTRNKREELETILCNRLKKETGEQDPVIVPTPIGITEGPFVRLSAVFETEVMLQIMFFAVDNVLVMTQTNGSTPPSAEAILDQTLHLIMVAIVERGATFARLSAQKASSEGRTLIDVLCSLETHDKYKTYKARSRWILDQLATHVPDDVERRRKKPEVVGKPKPDGEDAKKRAAKARQEAIMRQMKAQQASFAVNFDDVDEEDDDMGDGGGADAGEPVSFGTCIVCQEDLNTASKAFGALGMLQPSRVVRRQPANHGVLFSEVLTMPPSLDRSSQSPQRSAFPPPESDIQNSKPASTSSFDGFPSQSTRFGLHASVCSHMMHLDCFNVYSLSMRQRHRSQATRNHPESLSRKEYICPLCKSLGNIILPVSVPPKTSLSPVPFTDWIRASGISILKSKPDPLMESLQFKLGTGEFVFWSAQDSGYVSAARNTDKVESMEMHKIVDTIMATAKVMSQQTRHLRDRPEPEQGERGVGLYLPEELVGYTIAMMEIVQRGTGASGTIVADNIPEPQTKMIRGLVACLTKLAALHFKGRPDEGREAVRHAVIKRLLPEWSRATHAAFAYPLLLRDPFSLLVESAAVAPDMLRHILTLTYYACLARSVIGIVHLLQHKTRSFQTSALQHRQYEGLFGDVRMFFMSVVRHSPVFESSAAIVFRAFGEAQIEKLLYAFTLPFLRRAAILCRSMLPNAFPTASFDGNDRCEYTRLLTTLGIPPLSDLPNQDALQNALSGWCAHYGHLHAASQGAATVLFDFPAVYRIAKLPVVLDNLFEEKALTCLRCNTAPLDAAICLICGAVVCMQSHCCLDVEAGRGECNMHTRELVLISIPT